MSFFRTRISFPAGAACSLAMIAAVFGCTDRDGTAERQYAPPVDTLVALSPDEDAWSQLLHPVAITVAHDGRVFVGDEGDKTVKIYDATGRRNLGIVGGSGEGPGELRNINDVASLAGSPVVLDNNRGKIVHFDVTGGDGGEISLDGDRQLLASLGSDHLVLATSSQWSLPVTEDPPLFEVVSSGGEVVVTGAGRTESGSPFADYVMNFVYPAGAVDGETLWLADMNGTRVRRYSSGGRRADTTIRRSVPFDWRRIPGDFVPSGEMMERGSEADVPFDPVTRAIDTDAEGNAYLLTMLAPSAGPGQSPSEVSVDMVDFGSGGVRRFIVDGPATDLAVSPDGGRLYVLDSSVAQIRVYERP